VDIGFSQQYPEDDVQLRLAINEMVASANAVLAAEFNVVLVVGELLTRPDVQLDWNVSPYPHNRCPADMQTHLDMFTKWRNEERPNSQGVWHLVRIPARLFVACVHRVAVRAHRHAGYR
jgi:hypothetical protein